MAGTLDTVEITAGAGTKIAVIVDSTFFHHQLGVMEYVDASLNPIQVSMINALPVQPGTGATWAVTGTFWQATQPISASALPLPSGAATEATQALQPTAADFDSKIGSLTETAPATDTASSGLNGRLQRVAQRLTSIIGVLWTSLGQKTMANSVPVTIASDQTSLTFTANVGGIVPLFPTVSFTRPADTTAYATGDVMGAATTGNANYLTLTNCVRSNGGTGTIVGVLIEDSAKNSPTPVITLYIYTVAPSAAANDNAAWNPTTDQDNQACPPITVSLFNPLSANGILQATELFRPFACGGATTSLFLVPVMSGASYAPTSAEVFKLKFFIAPDA